MEGNIDIENEYIKPESSGLLSPIKKSSSFRALWIGQSLSGLVLLMIIIGASIMPFVIIWEGSLQELVPTESYGRVAGLDTLGTWALQPVGYIIAGWLAGRIGGAQAIVVESVIMVVITVGTLMMTGIKDFD